MTSYVDIILTQLSCTGRTLPTNLRRSIRRGSTFWNETCLLTSSSLIAAARVPRSRRVRLRGIWRTSALASCSSCTSYRIIFPGRTAQSVVGRRSLRSRSPHHHVFRIPHHPLTTIIAFVPCTATSMQQCPDSRRPHVYRMHVRSRHRRPPRVCALELRLRNTLADVDGRAFQSVYTRLRKTLFTQLSVYYVPSPTHGLTVTPTPT